MDYDYIMITGYYWFTLCLNVHTFLLHINVWTEYLTYFISYAFNEKLSIDKKKA